MATEQEIRNGAAGMTGTLVTAAVNMQRSMITSPDVLEWVKAGRVFSAHHGILTTPAAFETDLVRQTPDLMVRVPGSVVIIPIMVQVHFEATGAAVAQILVSSCDNDPGVSNMSAYTPVNNNTRYAGTASKCTAYITNTGATGTAPTNVCELARTYIQVDVDSVTGAANYDQFIYAPFQGRGAPATIGGADDLHAFLVNVGVGTSSTGYIIATWAEFTYAEYYGS